MTDIKRNGFAYLVQSATVQRQ